MGWFSDALFGKRKRINQNKINDYMTPYTTMIGEQEDIARDMMDPNSRFNLQQQQQLRNNQMDLVASQNQGLMGMAAMTGMSSGQAGMQAASNMNTARAQMGGQFAAMNNQQYNQGLGLLQNVMSMKKGEGERLANAHIQQVNAHNARRDANMQMTAGLDGSALGFAGNFKPTPKG